MLATRVKQIIVDQELDTLIAYSMDRARKLDMSQGSPEDLCAVVDLMEQSLPGPYILEGAQTENKTRSGRKSAETKPFVWHMNGVQERPQAMQAAPLAPATVTVPDVESIRRAADAEAQRRIAEHEAQRLREDLERLNEADADEDDAEEDAEDEADMPQPWYMNGEETIRVARELRGMFADLFTRRDAPAPPATSDLSEEERKLIQAARNFKATMPEGFEEMKGKLFDNFLNPSTNGNDQQ